MYVMLSTTNYNRIMGWTDNHVLRFLEDLVSLIESERLPKPEPPEHTRLAEYVLLALVEVGGQVGDDPRLRQRWQTHELLRLLELREVARDPVMRA